MNWDIKVVTPQLDLSDWIGTLTREALKITTNGPTGWIGTSKQVTPQLNSLYWIGTLTREALKVTTSGPIGWTGGSHSTGQANIYTRWLCFQITSKHGYPYNTYPGPFSSDIYIVAVWYRVTV